ncbi:MAG: sensor histidine kinase, partial [Planctomycetaceae bacterium]
MIFLRSASLALALTGLVWSLVLLVRVRDGRAACLAVLSALIAAGEALALAAIWTALDHRPDIALPDALLGLLTSAAAVAAVAFLERMLSCKQGELAQLRASVSERERIAEELDKARSQLVKTTQLATLGELSAQLAHDVRNCVTPISNYAYLIKRNLPPDQPPLREALEEIQEEVRMCDQILRNLVEYAGLQEPDRCWTDLSRLASKALRNLHLPEGVRVERCFQPDPLLAEIDPTQLRRVLDNLLRNAAEAVRDCG